MKKTKIILLLLFIGLFLTCKNKEELSNNSEFEFSLIKKFRNSNLYHEYEFDDENLVEIRNISTFNGGVFERLEFNYENNLINSIHHFNGESDCNLETLEYNSEGNLTFFKLWHSSNGDCNADSLSSIIEFFYDVEGNRDSSIKIIIVDELSPIYNIKFVNHYDQNGNISETKRYDSGELVSTLKFEYDDYLNPLKELNDIYHPQGSKNNLLKIIRLEDSEQIIQNQFEYNYNEFGLPVNFIEIKENGNIINFELEYLN